MAKAYINWGRWVVDCPCNSATALEDFATEVTCVKCGQRQVIEYPPEAKAIEILLGLRPGRNLGGEMAYPNRNWRPGESLKDLQRENKEHGL